jgi:diaminopimelate decarboxylase
MPSENTFPSHAPMHQFTVTNGELEVGNVPLTRLAARVGQTPFYAYDRALLRARVAEVRRVLPPTVKLHYALKANPLPALVGLMASLVDGMDVASSGELKIALDAGVNPAEVSFAGPGKRDAELRQAVASGVLINIESLREVPLLERMSMKQRLWHEDGWRSQAIWSRRRAGSNIAHKHWQCRSGF